MKTIAEIEKEFTDINNKLIRTFPSLSAIRAFFRTHLEERDQEIHRLANREFEGVNQSYVDERYVKIIADLQAKLEEANESIKNLRIANDSLEKLIYENGSLRDKLTEAEKELAEWKARNEFSQIGKLEKEIERLKTLIYSNDTSEWKSAAFQKIKELEAEIYRLLHPCVIGGTEYMLRELLAKAERALEQWKERNNYRITKGVKECEVPDEALCEDCRINKLLEQVLDEIRSVRG